MRNRTLQRAFKRADFQRSTPTYTILGLAFAAVWISTMSSAVAQTYLDSTGVPTFSAPVPVELGFIDTSNGNLHLSIPLGSFPQRASSKPLPVSFDYDSNIWSIHNTGGDLYWQTSESSLDGWLGGWRLSQSINASARLLPFGSQQDCTEDDYWMDQLGTAHSFHLLTNEYKAGCPASSDAYASDSSGFHIYVTNPYPSTGVTTVYAPDGSLAWTTASQTDSNGKRIISKDVNGNYISADPNAVLAGGGGIYDTLGRAVVVSDNSTKCSSSAYTVCYYLSNSQGATSTYIATTTTIQVKTAFGVSGVAECTYQSACTMQVLQNLSLPDGSSYSFKYDCDPSLNSAACGSSSGASSYYGELVGVTLATGGSIHYAYSLFKDAYGNKSQWLSYYQGSKGIYHITPSVLSTCSATSVGCQQQTTVQGVTFTSTNTFTLNNGAWLTSSVVKDPYGVLLASVTKSYDFSQHCVLIGCYGASFIRPTTEISSMPSSNGTLFKQTTYGYDSPQTGNVAAVKQWRYQPSQSFSSIPDRATYTSYLTTGTNDINHPQKVTLCSNAGSDADCPGGGAKVSQTAITYDSYGTSGLSTISGILHHDDTSFGAGNTQRGNPTQVARWVSGTAYSNTQLTYDTTGQVLTSADQAGNITTNKYTDSFATGSGTPSGSTNAYVTLVSKASGTESYSYFYGTGALYRQSEATGASEDWFYNDPLGRLTETTGTDGWSLYSYSSPTQMDVYTGVADTTPSTTCQSCQHRVELVDVYGRKSKSTVANDPAGPAETDTSYDGAGRVYEISHPYTGSGAVYETYSYDGLDRQLSVTHPDSESLQTAYGANVASLGGGTAQLGAAGSYGYAYPNVSIDEVSHLRQQWTDGFGRIIEVDEPGTTPTSSTSASGSVSIAGQEQSQVIDPCVHNGVGNPCPMTIYDTGSVTVTLDGFTAYASYGQSSTPQSIAASLVTSFNVAGSPVTASANGSSVSMTSKATGTAANYSFTTSSSSSAGTCPNGNPCFSPSFSGSPANGSLSGGAGGTATPVFTAYAYDAADNLTSVTQGTQTRTFAYDGLSRKISETTPEGGSVKLQYVTSAGALCSGDPSNVCQRTDARGVITTYTYDTANRITGIVYTIPTGSNVAAMPNVCTTSPNNTPANVCFTYQVGRSTFQLMTDPTGSERTTYAFGKLYSVVKIIGSQSYITYYGENIAGQLSRITYPSGRIVANTYDPIGQLCAVAPSAAACTATSSTYSNSYAYDAAGNLTSFNYGNGVTAARTYTPSREQLSSLKYANGAQTLFQLGYWYQSNATYCPGGSTGNNGQIQCTTDGVDGGRSAAYRYDSLGRLSSAAINGSTNYPKWGLAETYDRYGNLTQQQVTAGSGPSLSVGFTGKNQISGDTYDASGNLVAESLGTNYTYTYDGENRMVAFSGNGNSGTYVYDGNGMRVQKTAGGTTTVSIYDGSRVIAEYDNGAAPSSPTREYIYDDNQALAVISGGATTYFHPDHLSTRLMTYGSGSLTGQVVAQQGSFPFGEQWYSAGPANKWFFTTYNRDQESGLDYALARYYNSRNMRFTTPDPVGGDVKDPQTWNRYAYSRNSPIDLTDPSGKSFFSFFKAFIDGLSAFVAPPLAIFETAEWLTTDALGVTKGPPPAFGFGESSAIATSWNGSINIAYRGLGAGIQGALGLPIGGKCEFGACGGGPSSVVGQDPKNPSKPFEFGPGSYICGDFVCDPNGRQLGIALCGGCIHDSSDLIFLGAGVTRNALGIGIEAADGAAVSGFEYAFRPGSWLNQGQYWRIGFGRKGGLRVFRSVILGWKKDWWTGGPL